MQLHDIQQALDDHTIILNYYHTDTAVYGLAVTDNDFMLREIRIDSAYKTTVGAFIGEVYRLEEGRRYEGFSHSALLYQTLVQPFATLTDAAKNWVVIPDGDLFYLPFEALAYHSSERDYVLWHHAVSYHYSFALLLGQHTPPKKSASKNVLAFAPFSSADSAIQATGMPVLPLSGEEVEATGTQVFFGPSATKKLFLQKIAHTPVVHLATHASIGTDSSSNWIQFYPASSAEGDRLYVHDVYNLDLHNAELVVLSACETAGGVNAGGEGLLSLSRAFLYAGADGIVSTLWKTEDRVTAYLMQRMYHYLRQNRSPQWALHQAKKDLLQDPKMGSQYKTPNYWANFIYVGKLPETQPASNWWWLVAAGGLMAIMIVYRKKLRLLKRSFLR